MPHRSRRAARARPASLALASRAIPARPASDSRRVTARVRERRSIRSCRIRPRPRRSRRPTVAGCSGDTLTLPTSTGGTIHVTLDTSATPEGPRRRWVAAVLASASRSRTSARRRGRGCPARARASPTRWAAWSTMPSRTPRPARPASRPERVRRVEPRTCMSRGHARTGRARAGRARCSSPAAGTGPSRSRRQLRRRRHAGPLRRRRWDRPDGGRILTPCSTRCVSRASATAPAAPASSAPRTWRRSSAWSGPR